MKQNKKTIFTLILILLAVWLMCSNSVITKISGAEKGNEIIWDDSLDQKTIYCVFNRFEVMNAFTEVVDVRGWAFIESEHDSPDRYVSLILKGEDHCYEFKETEPTPVSEVLAAHPHLNVPSLYTGVQCNLSFIDVKNGTYDLYIYCWENSEDSGIAYTGYQIVKNNEGIQYRPWISDQTKPSNIKTEQKNTSSISLVSAKDNHIDIRGWCFADNVDSKEQKVYVLLKNEAGDTLQYEPRKMMREDVAKAYSNPLYSESGFRTVIPSEEIKDGIWNMYILIENEGKTYVSDAYGVKKEGTTIEIVESLESIDAMLQVDDKGNVITKILSIPLNALMQLCYSFTGNYILAIVVFTLLTKIILLPITLWMHRNGIKMVELMPDLNELKIKYFGDKETIAEETQVLYKKKGYQPLLSTLPMIIQIVLLMGVVEAVKALLGDSDSWLLLIPAEAGGAALLMPVAAGFAAFLLSVTQCLIAPLQKEQPKAEKLSTGMVSVCISLFLGAFVSLGTGVYWIASNLLSIPVQVVCNFLINPKKYVDYERLEDSRKKLGDMEGLEKKKEGYFSENRRRERADYKRFFSINNKHLVFYSEASGFYKYFKNTIEYLLAHSNINIHYVTNDPNDQIFKIAEKQPRIRAYYIGKQRCITLFMKMEADIVVMTTPDLDNFYLKRSYISKNIEYIYTPHAIGSTNMTTRRGAYDHFDTFFCVGQHHIDELRETEQMHQLKPKNLVPTGYGVLDQLMEAYASQNKEEKNACPRILIAPSWQEDNILDSCIDDMLTQLLKNDYQVIVRPHPEYVKRYRPRMDALITRYQNSIGGKLSFETDFSSNFNVFASDLLITDWSGIGYEFSLCTKRPTLFVNTKMKIFNPDYDKYSKPAMDITSRDEIGVSVNPNEMENINTIVNDMLQFQERYTERINNYVNQNIFSVGGYGEASAKYILKSLIEKVNKRKQNG